MGGGGGERMVVEMQNIHSALTQANEMLQTGLITTADYDALKHTILGKILA